MSTVALALTIGIAALWVGGEQFVLGATRLAERSRLPMILIGMVVAGFGTSMPELSVSVIARARGDAELALGNALGSNVANVLLVLPLAGLARSWTVRGELLRREILAVGGATVLLVGIVIDGHVSRAEASALLVSFLAGMWWLARSALGAAGRPTLEAEIRELVGPPPRRGQLAREIARTGLGLAVVLASADRLVWGAGRIAREFGVSETTIGLTLVAIGTSLPEVVTGIIAARRGEPDLVLGNVLGSNLFNALLVVGSAGAVGPLVMSGASRAIALPGLAATTLLIAVFLLPGYRVTRPQAVAWLAGYAAFVAALYVVR